MNRDYFLGGNTSRGFYSNYNYLADPEEINRIYIIKGGPGTGKSSLMKAVAAWGEKNGFDVDLIHCSSDPDSLDGVVINEIGIAMVDGTAPHIVDAKNAGVVETIVNMGDFWNETLLKKQKNEIIECNKDISGYFREAYNFLEAAGSINRNCRIGPSGEAVKETVLEIMEALPACSEKNSGSIRRLFADAVTPDGIVSYADRICSGRRVVLKSEICGGAYVILNKLAEKLIEAGYDVELFYSPLDPENEIRHIVLPAENVCILTSDFMSFVKASDAFEKDIDEMTKPEKYGSDFLRSRLLVFTLIQEAVKLISRAKKLHDKLESYYAPTLDFAAMDKNREKIISGLEEFAQQAN